MTHSIVARSVRHIAQVPDAWNLRASCERHYWNRAGADARRSALGRLIGQQHRAAIAVNIAEAQFETARQTLKGMQREGGIGYLGWTRASGRSFVLLRLPDPAPARLIHDILAVQGVLELEPDRDRTADYYGFAPEVSTMFDSACEPAYPDRTQKISLPAVERQDVLRALTLPVISRSPRRDPYLIAVIDDGIEWDHPYLGAHLWHNPKEIRGDCARDDDDNGYVNDFIGWNFHASSCDPRPSWGWTHGTQSAGLIAAIANNADLDVRIMALRTQGSGSRLPLRDLLRALNYASAHGARTILLAQSWELDGRDPRDEAKARQFEQALALAGQRNCLVVCAAGNGEQDIFERRCEPASSGLTQAHVLTAQGIGPGFGSSATASRFADQLIVAPGGNDIRTITVTRDEVVPFDGTSASAAIVAGISAVVAAHTEISDAAQLKTRLLSCRDPSATDPTQLEPRLINLRYLT